MVYQLTMWIVRMSVCSVVLVAGCREKPGEAALNAGIRAMERKNYDRSIELFKKVISELAGKKESAIIYSYLGAAYFLAGQRENAIQAFETSSQVDPALVEPVYNLGVLMLDIGNDRKAIICFEKAGMMNKKETNALEYLAHLYMGRSEWKNARRVLQNARKRAPNAPQIFAAQALLELKTDNVEKAVSLLQQALEHDACYAPAVYNLAAVNKQCLNDNNQALAYFNDYLHLSPEGPYSDKARNAVKEIRSKMPFSASNRIVILAGKPDVPECRTPRPCPPPPTFGELMRIARILRDQGRKEAAVNNYLRAVREAKRKGKQTSEKKALNEAVKVSAGNARAHFALGTYFFEQGNSSAAITHFKNAVSLSSSWHDAQMALANAALKQREFDTAVVSLKQANMSQPDDPDALWALAQLYDRNLGLTNLSAKCYNRFSQRFPDDSRAIEANKRLKELKAP